jgi:phasin family protein
MNTSVAERFTQAQSAAIESMLEVSKVYLNSTGRLTQLNMDALRDSVNEGTATFCALTGLSAGVAIKEARSEAISPAFERAMTYAREVQELAADTQEQVVGLANIRMAEMTRLVKLSA